MKIILEEESRKKVVLFCQTVENKLQYAINYHVKFSKKIIEPLNLNIIKVDKEITDKETERYEHKEMNDDFFQSKQKQSYIVKSNILEQCD